MRRVTGIALVSLPVIGFVVMALVFLEPAEQIKLVLMLGGIALAATCIVVGVDLLTKRK